MKAFYTGSRETTPALSPSNTSSSASSSPVLHLATPALPLRISNNGFFYPHPTWTPPNSKGKKSHAKKQPEGHITRFRNAFILFRCNVVDQKLFEAAAATGTLNAIFALTPLDNSGQRAKPSYKYEGSKIILDHRELSRFAAALWKTLSVHEQDPWFRMAERERQEHHQLNPGYRHLKTSGLVHKVKVPRREPSEDADPVTERPDSCPPGEERVSSSIMETLHLGYGGTITTRDDLSGFRRPSRVTLYTTATEEERVFEEAFDDKGRKMFNAHRMFGYIADDKRQRRTEKMPYSARFEPGVRPEDWSSDSDVCDADGMSDSSDENPISFGEWQDTWGGRPRPPNKANFVAEMQSTLPSMPEVPYAFDNQFLQDMQTVMSSGTFADPNAFSSLLGWPNTTDDIAMVGAEEGGRRGSLDAMSTDLTPTLPGP